MPFVTRQFTYTGATQNFTVPTYVTEVIIKAWGAGAGAGGGPGGYTTGITPVVPGDVLSMIVGQAGRSNQTTSTFGGGGGTTSNPFDPTIVGASGGGASYLFKNTSTLLLVAGGGGGGGSAGGFSYGGSGGGLTGTTAPNISTTNTGGSGGTQVAGGAGGVNTSNATFNGTAGSSFQGGKAGGTNGTNAGTGGGGGGGYFGGGGGSGQQSVPTPGQQETAGGGGSSYIGGVTNGSTLSTPQNTTGAAASFLPPNTTDPSYITNVGIGRPFPGFTSSVGGDGLIVLSYTLPDLILNKTVDKSYANTDNVLTYTISVKNSGPATLTNIVFVDTIPSGTTFQTNSLTIDNSPSPNNPNPPGFTIATLNPSVTTTIIYSVKVTSTIPTSNPILNVASAAYPQSSSFNSNTVSTQINKAIITQSKQVNKSYANISDILTYTIPITNSGNVSANNLLFVDTIPSGTTLVTGSFQRDGIAVAGSPSPPGVTFASLGPGRTTTIVFQVKVDTIPSPNPIPNSANVQSTYTVDPSIPNNDVANANSIIVFTQVNNASLGGVVKLVDKSFATCGEVITYTILAPNTGNVTAQNVIFKDTIPSGTVLLPTTVYVNGVQQNNAFSSTGITIPNIAPGTTATINFSVQVQC